jgi:hypothetical protein
MANKVPENLNYVCSRVQKLFTSFAENPSTIQHLLLYGSPGSGKTSSTLWLLKKIWPEEQLFSRVCFILNAADERSLEAIRAKCIPFIEVDWRSKGETRPRFLVLDECETLTESAQLALRPFLDNPSSSLCVIFLCNSLNRVHQTIRNACLRVRFNPPLPTTTSFSSIFYRGDLRQTIGTHAVSQKPTFMYIHRFLNNEFFLDFSPEEFISSLIFFIIFTDIIDDNMCEFIKCYGENQVFEFISLDQSIKIFREFLATTLIPKIESFNWTEEELVIEE